MCIVDTHAEQEEDAVAKWADSSLPYSSLLSFLMYHKPVLLP